MRCSRFSQQVSDWVAQRLPRDVAASMEEHAMRCPTCARTAEFERSLWRSMGALAPSNADVDVWAGVQARLAELEPAPSPRRVPLRWAFSGSLAAGAAAALLWFIATSGRPPVPRTDTAALDEAKAVQMAAAIQQLPDPDVEFTGESSRHIPFLQRAVLLGGDK